VLKRPIAIEIDDVPHQLFVAVWPGPVQPKGTIVCGHGALRNHTDFIPFAKQFSSDYRVVALDFPGHGASDFYGYLSGQVFNQNETLFRIIQTHAVGPIIYLGTSMGGLIGIEAASACNSPIDFLILNDIAPGGRRPWSQRLSKFLNIELVFWTKEDGLSFLDNFVPATEFVEDDLKDHFFVTNLRSVDEGWVLNHDPRLKNVLRDRIKTWNYDSWCSWEKVSCPVLLLKGGLSSVVSSEDMARMQQTKTKFTAFELAGATHPPPLICQSEFSVIHDWINDALVQSDQV